MNVETKPAESAVAIVADLGRRAKAAAVALRNAGTEAKNRALAEAARLIRINCFANDGGEWSKKKISFIEKNWIKVHLDKKFTTRTGRINCSLLDKDNQWRWLGFQFVVDGN